MAARKGLTLCFLLACLMTSPLFAHAQLIDDDILPMLQAMNYLSSISSNTATTVRLPSSLLSRQQDLVSSIVAAVLQSLRNPSPGTIPGPVTAATDNNPVTVPVITPTTGDTPQSVPGTESAPAPAGATLPENTPSNPLPSTMDGTFPSDTPRSAGPSRGDAVAVKPSTLPGHQAGTLPRTTHITQAVGRNFFPRTFNVLDGSLQLRK